MMSFVFMLFFHQIVASKRSPDGAGRNPSSDVIASEAKQSQPQCLSLEIASSRVRAPRNDNTM
jgi:hypothetical protein